MASTLMFHSIGLRRHPWRSPQIAEDTHYFRDKVRALAGAGYRSTFFTDPALRAPMSSGDGIVCLSFDDGYLDNWVHVFPVLEEFGFKATILATTDFVDPRDVLRDRAPSTHRDDASHDPRACCAGFLSWPEMRAMEESGLVEIQSHALTHNFYFSGPRIVDFWHPGSATEAGGAVWMLWNECPEEKPFYLTRAAELEQRIPYGTPIYEHRKSLEAPRWFPDEPGLAEALASFVEANGGNRLFDRVDWRDELRVVADANRGTGERGRLEGESEYFDRMRHELSASKSILERGLGHEVSALVWPGGGVSRDALQIAHEVGYRIFSRPAHMDFESSEDTWTVDRVGSICRERWRGIDLGNLSGREFLWRLRAAEGSELDRWRSRGSRLARLAAARLGLVGD